eukprot:TRINITY_DN11534_c0_g2_i1.p1 TRINITY_DN11534_c0_g2~~TRINITY_DN11534_c0_g2_i1.p1  ORF type:complete len:386 (-),score=34.69 TRINITY_DN11534_c0_g2_i1:53-1210(-)
MVAYWIACMLALSVLGFLGVANRYRRSVANTTDWQCFCRMLPQSECPELKKRDSHEYKEARFFHPHNQSHGICCKLRQPDFARTCRSMARCYDKQEDLQLCMEDRRKLPSSGCCNFGKGVGVVINHKRHFSKFGPYALYGLRSDKPHIRKEDIVKGVIPNKEIWDVDTVWSYLISLNVFRHENDHFRCQDVSDLSEGGTCLLRKTLSECCCPDMSPTCLTARFIVRNTSWANHEQTFLSTTSSLPRDPEFQPQEHQGVLWWASQRQWQQSQETKCERWEEKETHTQTIVHKETEVVGFDMGFMIPIVKEKEVEVNEPKTVMVPKKKCVEWRHTKRCPKGQAMYEPMGTVLKQDKLVLDENNPVVMQCPANMVKRSKEFKCECPRT